MGSRRGTAIGSKELGGWGVQNQDVADNASDSTVPTKTTGNLYLKIK